MGDDDAPLASDSGLECRNCGAALSVAPAHLTAQCPYCASHSVIHRPPSPDRPDPTFALGFVLPRERALEIAQRWVKSAWLAPQAFRHAVVDQTRGTYVPAYLYTAVARSSYRAQIGENYTKVETYTVRNSKGVPTVRTRVKHLTEWRSLSGKHSMYVSDRVVTASRAIPNTELERLEPFDLRALRRFTPKLISGWIAEEPSLSHSECEQLARSEALAMIAQRLFAFMPGDSYRNLNHQTRLTEENLELALLPIWVLPVRWGEDHLSRLLINGQTGRIFGRPPTSWVKLSLLVLLFIAVAVGLWFILTGSPR